MIHSLSKNIAVFLFSENDDYPLEIYTYGLELIMSSLIGNFIIMCIGLIINRLFEGLIYIITLFAIRSFSGGYHSKTYLKCNIIFASAFVFSILIHTVILRCFFDYILLIYSAITFLLIITLFAFSPIENKNKKIYLRDRKKYKLLSIIATVILSIIAMIIYLFCNSKQVLFVFSVFVIIGISIFAEIILKRREKDEGFKKNNKNN